MHDLIGQKFGRLSVVGLIPGSKKEKRKRYWVCNCECGNKTTVSTGHLRNGSIQACGCQRGRRNNPTRAKLIDALKWYAGGNQDGGAMARKALGKTETDGQSARSE